MGYGQQAVERLIIGWRTRMIQKTKMLNRDDQFNILFKILGLIDRKMQSVIFHWEH